MPDPERAPQDREAQPPWMAPLGSANGRVTVSPHAQRASQIHPSGTRGHLVVVLMDIARRIMVVSAAAAVAILAYLIYQLVAGIVPNWTAAGAALTTRAIGTISGATGLLNIAFVLFLITLCYFNWSEGALGASLAIGGLVVYFGVPFLFDFLAQGQIATWQTEHNLAALAIYNELQTLGLLAAIPGVPLFIRTVFMQSRNTLLEKHEALGALPYGGATAKEKPVPGAIVGAVAKCWQLPYCKPIVREGCPIYLARARCWRKRVGCMCEHSITNIAEPLMRKTEISSGIKWSQEAPALQEQSGEGGVRELAPWQRNDLSAKQQASLRTDAKTGRVKIPYNTVLSAAAKRERCRNCIIYNEHQRQKYRLLAPLAVIVFAIVTWLFFGTLTDWLGSSVVSRIDATMAGLALDPNAHQLGAVASGLPTTVLTVLAACGLIITLAIVLRIIEYCIFVLKI